MKTVKLATFIENPDNPQTVTAEDFALLVESLRLVSLQRKRLKAQRKENAQ